MFSKINVLCRRLLSSFFPIIIGLYIAVSINGQAVDPNFYPVITSYNYAVVTVSAVQSDGKVVIAGTFGAANGFKQSGVARLLPNGKTVKLFNRFFSLTEITPVLSMI